MYIYVCTMYVNMYKWWGDPNVVCPKWPYVCIQILIYTYLYHIYICILLEAYGNDSWGSNVLDDPHMYIYIFMNINCTFVSLCTCLVQNVFSRGALGAHIGAVSAGIFGVGWLRLLTNIALKWIIIGKYKVLRKQKKTSRKSCELQVVTKLYMTFCMIGDFRLMSGIGKTKIETQSKSSSDNRDTFEWF